MMNELALFAGAGGGILGGHLLGWRTVCAVEYEPYAAGVLLARQNDGLLPPFPVWDDVRTFDGRPWAGVVDVVSGGFPCQDISVAGGGKGIDGERSGLWSEMARIVGEVRPRYVFVENSPALTARGLGRVLGDLAALGYDAEWGVLGAADVGAPHKRERIWIVAYTAGQHCDQRRAESAGQLGTSWPATGGNDVADSDEIGWMWRAWMLGRVRGDEFKNCGEVANAEGERCREARKLRHDQPEERTVCCGEKNPNAYGLDVQRVKRSIADKKGWSGPNIRPTGSFCNGAGWWATEPDVGRVAHGVAARVDRLKAIGNGQVPQCAAEALTRLMERLKDQM